MAICEASPWSTAIENETTFDGPKVNKSLTFTSTDVIDRLSKDAIPDMAATMVVPVTTDSGGMTNEPFAAVI